MMEAINRARAAGYEANTGDCQFRIFHDPAFWQALGKVEGWSRGIDPETGEEMLADPSEVFDQEVWKDNWHRLIDHIANGGSAEEFFSNLLKP